ncbi:hypothetical protein NBRC3255_2906 [Gluconobacter thailandicus NBRC 3255]|nr:hypothetical protein NBRC3255_2906 [Gluconobacter thailandicus NBRC 3255]
MAPSISVRLVRASFLILNRLMLPPLRHCFRVDDPEPLTQRRE